MLADLFAKPLLKLDTILGRITMYRLLLWGLRILTALGIIFSFTHIISLSFWGLVWSLIILIGTCFLTNKVMAATWKVPTNYESYPITALILFLILPPATTPTRAILIAAAGVIAMVSKYLITVHDRHLFNPAAFAAVVVGFFGITTFWWIGSSILWPFALILGLLVVRKIRRFSLVLTFASVSLIFLLITSIAQHQPLADALKFAITSSPLIFLGTIMLTEPATMPAHRYQQVIYGALVGLLYAMPWNPGPLHIYPETALVIGNFYAFAVNPHFRLHLKLERIENYSDRVANYVFTPNRRITFKPGQYMEWTVKLPHVDSRGNRRTFSVASSPTEERIMIGVKFYEPSSKFKAALKNFKPGDTMVAGQLAGDFILPKDQKEKLVFIAGGIGITPFRSMLKYLVDTRQQRDVIMIYAVADPGEVAYGDVLKEAESQGIRIIRLLTTGQTPPGWQGTTGKLSAEFIAEQIPDHADRAFYLSGPQPMVEGLKSTIRDLGVKTIKADYFTGY
jgi:ferredoxin-NADP reductase